MTDANPDQQDALNSPESIEVDFNFTTQDLEFDHEDFTLNVDEANFSDDYAAHDNAEYKAGRMTPDGLIDEDFEAELGCPKHEMTVQESIDRDFEEISRLGIIQVAGDDRLGRKVIVFSACRLPAANRIDLRRLLAYILKTLEQYVTSDYCLIYFHYGYNNENKFPLTWIRQAYLEIDRNFKKNLKALYIVHPTRWVRFFMTVFKPILSSKFGQKITYIQQLDELQEFLHVDQLQIPIRVKEFDKELMTRRSLIHLAAAGNQRDSGDGLDSSFADRQNRGFAPPTPTQQFGVSLQHIKLVYGYPVAPVMIETIKYLRTSSLQVVGIFRRVPLATLVQQIKTRINNGEHVNFSEFDDPHLVAVLLKSFLRELTEPLMTFELYDEIISVQNLSERLRLSAVRRIVVEHLPDDNYTVLQYLMCFLAEVAENSNYNMMTAQNLSVVFGPNLIWSRQQPSLTMIGHINAFTHQLISSFDEIFIKEI